MQLVMTELMTNKIDCDCKKDLKSVLTTKISATDKNVKGQEEKLKIDHQEKESTIECIDIDSEPDEDASKRKDNHGKNFTALSKCKLCHTEVYNIGRHMNTVHPQHDLKMLKALNIPTPREETRKSRDKENSGSKRYKVSTSSIPNKYIFSGPNIRPKS